MAPSLSGSAAELAASVDVVLTSPSDDDALDAVASEVLRGARAGTVLVDMSTVSPAASARVGAAAEAASVDYLRAPVSCNPSVVRAGKITFIVSGPPAAFERVEPVLRAVGPTIHCLGKASRPESSSWRSTS